jgi:LAO/AO transport system kinase
LAGDRGVLARAITLVESTLAADRERIGEVLDGILPHTGNSRRVGITGVPGAGKSTWIEALGWHLMEERGEKVAVLSIDPSSPLTGGSILGDKTRMPRLASDARAYVRPSPARGHLGGVARRTRETMLLCEAAGYENVLIETVGVGQSETAARRMTDFFLVLMLGGAGDELQGMKRGLLEMVDCVAVNKADGANREAAERARGELSSALRLFPAGEDGWRPEVVLCSALTGSGVREIWEIVLRHRREMEARGVFAARRREQALEWMRELVQTGMAEAFERHAGVGERIAAMEGEVAAGRVSAPHAAQELLRVFLDERRNGGA